MIDTHGSSFEFINDANFAGECRGENQLLDTTYWWTHFLHCCH